MTAPTCNDSDMMQALADRARDDGLIDWGPYATLRALAGQLGCTRLEAAQSLTRLELAGFLVWRDGRAFLLPRP